MEMNKACPDICDVVYIHQLQLGPTQKIQEQQQKHQIKRYPPMKHLSNDHEDRPNPHENNQKVVQKKGTPYLEFEESQCKPRKQHDQKFPMEGEVL